VLKSCLASFAQAHAELVHGNERLPGVFSEALREVYFGKGRADERIRQFVAQAERAALSIAAGGDDRQSQVDALVAQATPLLELLQEITLAYQHEMRGVEAAATKRQVDIAERLGNISMQANIVALNARISAARAGKFGREFAVITTVLADIIKEMDELIQSVVDTSGASGTSARRAVPSQGWHARADRALQ
jgi:methyl-accepting chemotaxis protein